MKYACVIAVRHPERLHFHVDMLFAVPHVKAALAHDGWLVSSYEMDGTKPTDCPIGCEHDKAPEYALVKLPPVVRSRLVGDRVLCIRLMFHIDCKQSDAVLRPAMLADGWSKAS